MDDAFFLSESEGNGGRDLSLDFIVAGPHASGSKKGFKFMTGRKNCKRYSGRYLTFVWFLLLGFALRVFSC